MSRIRFVIWFCLGLYVVAECAPGSLLESNSSVSLSDTSSPKAHANSDTSSKPSGLILRNRYFTKLELGGTVQFKAYYSGITDRDGDKRLGMALRVFRIDLDAALSPHFGVLGQFRLDANDQQAGIESGLLYYSFNEFLGVRAGKVKRPFSQEALQSSKALYTIERGELYQNFLSKVTGYSMYDIGVVAYGGFVEDKQSVSYEAGIFNGKQNDDPASDYGGQQYESSDKGLRAKDLVLRLSVSPYKLLKLEAGLSTKAAEDQSDPAHYKLGINTAYEVGADFAYSHLRLLGEVAWGDNHQGRDALILSGSSQFFAFYGTGIWREEYSRDRASELVLKIEGLDPDFEPDAGKGTPNDGKLLYTFGSNFFFTPRVSIMADYSVLQAITKVVSEKKLIHSLGLLWRMSF